MLLVKWLVISLFFSSGIYGLCPSVLSGIAQTNSPQFLRAVETRTEELIPIVTEWLSHSPAYDSKEAHLKRLDEYENLTPELKDLLRRSIEGRYNPKVIARVIAELEVRTNQKAGKPLDSKDKFSSDSEKDRENFEDAASDLARSLDRPFAKFPKEVYASFNSLLYSNGKGVVILDYAFKVGRRSCGDGKHTVDGHMFQQFTDIFALGVEDFDKLMKFSVDANIRKKGKEEQSSVWGIIYDSPFEGSSTTSLMFPNGASQAICACSRRLPYK